MFLVAMVLLAVFIVSYFKNTDHEKRGDLPYIKKEYFMTKAESEFFKVLEQAVQGRYYIIPQVQLSNLVQPEKGKERDYAIRNKIDRKSVDFVLFNKEFFTPYLVIELDDNSHLKEDRVVRDGFVDRVLVKAGIKIIHIPTSYNYKIEEISTKLL